MKMRIMIAAAKIRMRQGMTLEEVLAAWPNLTEEEQAQIREALK